MAINTTATAQCVLRPRSASSAAPGAIQAAARGRVGRGGVVITALIWPQVSSNNGRTLEVFVAARGLGPARPRARNRTPELSASRRKALIHAVP